MVEAEVVKEVKGGLLATVDGIIILIIIIISAFLSWFMNMLKFEDEFFSSKIFCPYLSINSKIL